MGLFDMFKRKKPDFGLDEEEPVLRKLPREETGIRDDDFGLPKPRLREEIAPQPFSPVTPGRENDVLNVKVDRIIDKLELMDKRLQEIEKIAKEE